MYCVHDHPYAYANVTNFGDGRGLLQIYSDWGTYSFYWGSMGGTIEAFLSECNDSYVHTKLKSSLNNQGIKKEYQGRLGRFMTDCWPRLKAVIAEAELSRTRDGGSK